MESLSQSIPIPATVALVTGFLFLLHARPSAKVKTPNERTTPPASPNTSQEPSQAVSKESEFPVRWWSGKDVFELERRAVFSKTWIPILPRARFVKPGDYHSIEVAGFPIFLILGKDGRVRAFHNVCRHRAYTVTRREAGSSAVLACRYHGWSYNTYGELVKAPHFDNVSGFDKAQNGLFEIHTEVSRCGFIFVNFDAGQVVWEPGTSAVLDEFASRNGFGGELSWVGGETLEGKFNWKLGWTLGRFLNKEGLEQSMAILAGGSLAAKAIRYFKRQEADDVAVYPNASFHTIRDTELLYSLSFLPASEQKTLIRYDLFSRSGNAVNPGISENLKGFLIGSIRGLEGEYQFHLSKVDESALNESADLARAGIQKQLLDQVNAHAKLEKTSGGEVFPARRQPRPNQRFQVADQLCKDLDCQSGQPSNGAAPVGNDLAW